MVKPISLRLRNAEILAQARATLIRAGRGDELKRAQNKNPSGLCQCGLRMSHVPTAAWTIRPRLLEGEGVTLARPDVHYVVTEFGIAYLFGKSVRERAMALIESSM
jgi:hypothetical protein